MSLDLLAEVRVTAGAGSPLVDVSTGDANLLTVDRLGFMSVAFALGGDAANSGACNFYMQHSDDASTWVDVPVDLLLNRSAAAVTAAVAGRLGSLTSLGSKLVVVGTLSKKRYVRIRQGDSSAPSGFVAVTVLRYNATRSPVLVTTW